MPETDLSGLVYESRMISQVTGMIHQIYTEVSSDEITRHVRQVLADDEDHRPKPNEVAKEVVSIINGTPQKKKRKASKRTPESKDITAYLGL